MSFLTALLLLFIGLKLTGFIAWPWFYVMMPLIVQLVIALVLVIIAAVVSVASR